MAGLMSMAGQAPEDPTAAAAPPVDPAAPPAAAPPADDAAPSPDDQGGDGNVSPEEQAQYDKFVTNGMHIIYPDGQNSVAPEILQQLKGKDPLESLARTTVGLVTGLKQSAKKAGTDITDDVMLHGGMELLEHLAEVSEAAGIHDYKQEELNGSFYRALDLYREAGVQTGDVNEDDLKQQFAQIQQADESGQLDKVLPGVNQAPAPKAEPADDQEAAAPQQQGAQ